MSYICLGCGKHKTFLCPNNGNCRHIDSEAVAAALGFPLRSEVIIFGLQQAPKHNNKIGTVEEVVTGGRLRVRLHDEARDLACQPANLRHRRPLSQNWKDVMAQDAATKGFSGSKRGRDEAGPSCSADHTAQRARSSPSSDVVGMAWRDFKECTLDPMTEHMLRQLPAPTVQVLSQQPELRPDRAVVDELIVDEPPVGAPPPTDGFETRREYSKRLEGAGLLEREPGARHEGQHVFHIISASNGGPNHRDNYLYALGGSFNMAIGDKFDHVNCYMAGKAKAEKAVAIAMKVAADPSLYKHIEDRGNGRKTYNQGAHQGLSADVLYKRGENIFRDLRKLARDKAKSNATHQ